MPAKPVLYLIDGSSQMYRAYHAPVRTAEGGLLRNAKGQATNAVYIFVTMLRKLLNEQTPQFPAISVTRYNYDDWRGRAKSFADVAAFRPTNMTITGAGDPERVPAKMISAGLLPLLGIAIEHGRGFGAADDRPGAEGVALVTPGLAARKFAG